MASYQAHLSLGFSRQEHWSGCPFPSLMHESEKWKWSRSVVSDSQQLHGLQPTRLLPLWDFPGKSTGVGFHEFYPTTLPGPRKYCKLIRFSLDLWNWKKKYHKHPLWSEFLFQSFSPNPNFMQLHLHHKISFSHPVLATWIHCINFFFSRQYKFLNKLQNSKLG